MKFAHLADVHIGAWKHPELSDLPDYCFEKAIALALESGVDFILIAGDLFDSALPGIHHLRSVVRTLRSAKKVSVPVYTIPGSHDFSPTGKSMLHVLEEAGLIVNVYKGSVVDEKLRLDFTVDAKTGVKITGILGRKGSLETKHYEDLDREWIESHKEGYSIFMFHSSVDELKPTGLSQMSSFSVSMLPKGFDYYAGGHVHITEDISLTGYAKVAYPGPVFPASFSELEKLGGGSMILVEDGRMERVSVPSRETLSVKVEVSGSAESSTSKIIQALQNSNIEGKIVLLRISGTIDGAISDIDFKRILSAGRSAHVLLRNTSQLQGEINETSEVEIGSVDEIEKKIFAEYASGEEDIEVMQTLLRVLSSEKKEGETNTSYDERMIDDAKKILKVE